MKRIRLIVLAILVLAAICCFAMYTPKQPPVYVKTTIPELKVNENGKFNKAVLKAKNLVSKSKAQADISNAAKIGLAIAKAFAEGKIVTEEKEQELSNETGIGKLLLVNNYLSKIPKCKIDNTYKYFVSVSNVGEIIIKVGIDAPTAVELFPRPEKFEKPYDIVNK